MSLIPIVIAGAITGILINYFSDVLPDTRGITPPVCRECNQPYSLKDYLFSFSCSNCGRGPSVRSIVVLISSMAACVLLQFFPFSIFNFWASIPILIFLGVIVVIDIEHRLVLIETSLFGLVLCLIYGTTLHGFLGAIMGALVGFLIMLFFYILGIIFSIIIGKIKGQKMSEVAFGFGDVMVGAFLGMLTGTPAILGVILIAIFSFGAFSLVYLLALLLSKQYRAFASALPFAPFLILGAITAFYL